MQTKLQSTRAFTKLELIVTTAALLVLAALLLPLLSRTHICTMRDRCANNLKQIGIGYRIWSRASNPPGTTPASLSIKDDGWRDYLNQTNAGRYCWTNYVLMQNELGDAPKLLNCPNDERRPASDFNTIANTNISYFVGANASEDSPQSFLSGDRNLSPGLTGKNDYGFSPPNGQGNDIWIKTNSTTDPICWSLKMHSDGDPRGAGNILLGDGSVQQVSSAMLRNLQTNAATATKDDADEKHKTSFRLIFP